MNHPALPDIIDCFQQSGQIVSLMGGKKLITVFAQGSLEPKKGAEAIKYVNNIFDVFGWKLEDCIHCCGTDDEIFNELSSRAFKDGENLA